MHCHAKVFGWTIEKTSDFNALHERGFACRGQPAGVYKQITHVQRRASLSGHLANNRMKWEKKFVFTLINPIKRILAAPMELARQSAS